MTAPLLTSVTLALPDLLQTIQHIGDQVNELLLPETIDAAVYNDLAHVLRVYGTSRRWTVKAMDGAAAKGRLDLVRWLHETRSEGCSKAAMDGAAANGHLTVMRWLHEHRTEGCSPDAMNSAAANGHLEVTKWLKRRYQWSSDALTAAAKSGADEVVTWFLDACDETRFRFRPALLEAAANGHVKVVRLLLEECCSDDISTALDLAAADGHIDVVEVLLTEKPRASCTGEGSDRKTDQRDGYQITYGLEAVAASGDVRITQLMLKECCDVTYMGRGLKKAAVNGHVEVVKLLLGRSCRPTDVECALKEAVARGNTEVTRALMPRSPDSMYKRSLVAKMTARSRHKRAQRMPRKLTKLPTQCTRAAQVPPFSMSTSPESTFTPSLFVFGEF
ncbi:hypothetical protein BBJ28_00021025 [Nothophytophthora sp. Chile5]|nr:hypothetical protein BBJ28_00021025 [Nothophytophthora sp. Chile5]